MAAAMAVPGARLGSRFGPGRVGAVGALLFALGGVWWVTHLGGDVRYAGDFLPGMMIGGVGVGLMIPSLTGAVAATLAPERLATGIAVQTTGRQIGSALGFAILVAVLGTPHTAGDFKAAWELMMAASLLAGVALVAIGGRAAAGAPESAESAESAQPAQFAQSAQSAQSAAAQSSPGGVTPLEGLI
jgi:MFS family permease